MISVSPCFPSVRLLSVARYQQVRRGEGREVRDVSKDRNRRSSRDRGSSRGRDSHKDRDRARESESRTRVRDERDPRGDEDRRKRARGDEEGPQ